MKYALFYESSERAAELAPLHFPAHRARWQEYVEKGALLLIGPFADGSGALAIFTAREAAEEFAANDPFVLHGVVKGWQIREWREALAAS